MYIQLRKDRLGNPYFSFSYSDESGKRIRLRKEEHPFFASYDEALSWAKSQDAYRASEKARIERKLSWKGRYYQFEELLTKYEVWQSSKAPNSYKMNRYYLEYFVFPFFLQEKKASNVNNWHLLYQEFYDWLASGAEGVRKKKGKIAKATGNNIIKTLNTFIDFLSRYNHIDPENVKKMHSFPDHMTNHKDFSDVIDAEEFKLIHKSLTSLNPLIADFFYVLYNTGMRFNELFSLSYNSIHAGKVPDEGFHQELERYSLKYHGYILLQDQALHDDRKRNEDGTISRKPLKSRKTISHKNSRVIPIFDAVCWNILVKLFKQEKLKHQNTARKSSKAEDYVLFDDLEWNKTSLGLRRTYAKYPRIKTKSYHCCRHSYVTNLTGRTRSFFLVQAITGHKTQKIFERYLHLYERMRYDRFWCRLG